MRQPVVIAMLIDSEALTQSLLSPPDPQSTIWCLAQTYKCTSVSLSVIDKKFYSTILFSSHCHIPSSQTLFFSSLSLGGSVVEALEPEPQMSQVIQA